MPENPKPPANSADEARRLALSLLSESPETRNPFVEGTKRYVKEWADRPEASGFFNDLPSWMRSKLLSELSSLRPTVQQLMARPLDDTLALVKHHIPWYMKPLASTVDWKSVKANAADELRFAGGSLNPSPWDAVSADPGFINRTEARNTYPEFASQLTEAYGQNTPDLFDSYRRSSGQAVDTAAMREALLRLWSNKK